MLYTIIIYSIIIIIIIIMVAQRIISEPMNEQRLSGHCVDDKFHDKNMLHGDERFTDRWGVDDLVFFLNGSGKITVT